jgi:hypothetical protein
MYMYKNNDAALLHSRTISVPRGYPLSPRHTSCPPWLTTPIHMCEPQDGRQFMHLLEWTYKPLWCPHMLVWFCVLPTSCNSCSHCNIASVCVLTQWFLSLFLYYVVPVSPTLPFHLPWKPPLAILSPGQHLLLMCKEWFAVIFRLRQKEFQHLRPEAHDLQRLFPPYIFSVSCQMTDVSYDPGLTGHSVYLYFAERCCGVHLWSWICLNTICGFYLYFVETLGRLSRSLPPYVRPCFQPFGSSHSECQEWNLPFCMCGFKSCLQMIGVCAKYIVLYESQVP